MVWLGKSSIPREIGCLGGWGRIVPFSTVKTFLASLLQGFCPKGLHKAAKAGSGAAAADLPHCNPQLHPAFICPSVLMPWCPSLAARLLGPARGEAVPLHVLARARCPLPRHGAAGLHPPREGVHAARRRPHCHPLQVGAGTVPIPRGFLGFWDVHGAARCVTGGCSAFEKPGNCAVQQRNRKCATKGRAEAGKELGCAAGCPHVKAASCKESS